MRAPEAAVSAREHDGAGERQQKWKNAPHARRFHLTPTSTRWLSRKLAPSLLRRSGVTTARVASLAAALT
jgi:hypothetical protein